MCNFKQCVLCGGPAHHDRICLPEGSTGSANGTGLEVGGASSQAAVAGTRDDGAAEVVAMAAALNWKRCPGCGTFTEHELGCNYTGTCFIARMFCGWCLSVWQCLTCYGLDGTHFTFFLRSLYLWNGMCEFVPCYGCMPYPNKSLLLF